MNPDLVAMATAIAVIIGIVNGVALADAQFTQEGKPPRITSFVKFVLAMLFGLLFGFLHFFGLAGIEMGIIAALASSGLYKLAQVM